MEVNVETIVPTIDTMEEILFVENKSIATKTSKRSILLTAASITNNIIGAGVITLPLAIKESGLGLGIILLSLSAVACGWTFTMMAMCGELVKTTTYEKTVQKLLGNKAYMIITICSIVFPITGTCSYGIIIATNLISCLKGMTNHYPMLESRPLILIIPFFFIIFPLSILKNMKSLSKFSTFSIVLVSFYVFTILFKLGTIPYKIQTLPNTFVFGTKYAIKTLPVFAFACSCHHNVISFYRSLENTSLKSFRLSKDISFIFTFFIYVIVSLSGFVTFGGQPSDNIFVGYCPDDYLMNLTRLIFSITLLLTTPLNLFAAQKVLTRELLCKYKEKKWLTPLVTFIIVTICFLISSFVQRLSLVIEIGGAISNVPIVYIFPAACAIAIYGKPYFTFDLKRGIAWAILIFGTLMLIFCPIFSILSYLKDSQVMEIEKYYC